jgi:NAD(P)-dependent dehydrogenase (short-subunit alcohol dehydrogenase family)
MPNRLAGKIAVITGAAAGIGAATARLFAEEGAALMLLDQDPAGEAVARAIRDGGGNAHFVQTDIAKDEEVRSAMQQATQLHGRIDILVNNAATFVFKGLEATAEDWHRSLDVNVIGTAQCARYAAESMQHSGGGAIVNLGAISSFVAQPQFMTYNATKAAIVNMTKCMALDLAPFNIRVNCVCPGTIRTAATDRHMAHSGISEEQFIAENAPLHLLNRIGQPREVAYAILFLASDEASFITAATLMVDGGYLAR